MGKPFFYKIVAAELMSEVLQIPDGCHKQWLTQFVIDLVSAKGSTPYTSKLIHEVQKFRERQAESGSRGGKKSRKRPLSDPQGLLKRPSSDPQANDCQALGISSSNSTELYTIQGQTSSIRSIELDGKCVSVDTGEVINPFG